MKLQPITTQTLTASVETRLKGWLNEGAVMILLAGPGMERSGLPHREYLIWLLLAPRSAVRAHLENSKPPVATVSPAVKAYAVGTELRIPTMYEMNPECTEATGTVLHFCDEKCRDIYSRKRMGNWNHGTDVTYIADEQCTMCGKTLTDDLFRQEPLPVAALIDDETLGYLNCVWGPGIRNVRDIDAQMAWELLENAQTAGDENPLDRLAFNAYAALHGFPSWDDERWADGVTVDELKPKKGDK
jgi:hypothetical protein